MEALHHQGMGAVCARKEDLIVDVPPNHLSVNEESKPKSHEHVVPNDTCIDVTNVHGYSFVLEPESDGISCDHIKPSTEFSNAVDNETDLGDKLSDASHLESKEAVICPMYLLGQMMTSSECFAQAQSHPVDESYGGDPNFLSDVLQLMSNAPDLAPEKEKDQLLGSTLSRPLPDCSPASIACDADVKPVCIASEIDANVPENGFNLKNSTPVADMPHTLTLTEQWSSEITVDDSIPETVQAEPVAVAAAAAFGANGEDDFPSGYTNYPDPKDHLSLDDLVTESVPMAVHFAKICWPKISGFFNTDRNTASSFGCNWFWFKKGTLQKEALDKELNPMVKYGLRPGTLKGELFSILLNQGNNGMKVPDLARCVQISELNLAGTTEELELLIYSTLSSDITLYEKISSSSYRSTVTSHINEAENFQSDTDDSGSIDDDSKDNRKCISNNDSDSDSGTPNLGKLNYMNHHKQRNGMLTIYTEIDETYRGEVWLLGLMEGEYSDLSIEEKLNALMALVDLVSGGSSIRMA
ncbi:hypothetical protein AAG906_005402 [Vitis piasezkii]